MRLNWENWGKIYKFINWITVMIKNVPQVHLISHKKNRECSPYGIVPKYVRINVYILYETFHLGFRLDLVLKQVADNYLSVESWELYKTSTPEFYSCGFLIWIVALVMKCYSCFRHLWLLFWNFVRPIWKTIKWTFPTQKQSSFEFLDRTPSGDHLVALACAAWYPEILLKRRKKHHWPRTETGKHLARASGSAFLEFLLKVWRRSVEDKLERNINIDLSVRKVRPMYPSLLFHTEKLPISERIQDLAWSLPHRPAQSHLKINKDWVRIHSFKIKASPMWMTDVAYIWLCTASLLSSPTLSYSLTFPWIGLRAE